MVDTASASGVSRRMFFRMLASTSASNWVLYGPTSIPSRVWKYHKNKNEGEDGLPNVRDGKTNYFIFPGETGADASWLQGKDFKAKVKVSFEHAGRAISSEAFELIPHTH